jgi:signal transduction histidine kinase
MLAILHEEMLKIVKEMDVRRRAEEALSLKTALLEAQMEASIDGIIVLDEKRNPLIMIRRLVEIGGVPEQVLALEDNNAVYDHLSGIVEDPETVMGIFSHLDEHPWEIYRDELKFKDGRVLDRYTAPVTGTEGQLYGRLWILRDITGQRVAEEERKKIESRLNQSEKIEAIGNLAGGIAHDFNNILGVIMGYCSILRNRMAEGDPGISYVNNIMSASEKAVDLVKSLLAFGRKQNIEIKHCRINEIVRGVEKLLVRLLPEDINLSVELDESEPVIMADISQIDRVFLNLATNSRDAMPAGGSFVIRTGTVLLDREFMDTWGYGEPGRYVLVSVSDTGKGFDEVTGKRDI